MSVGTEKYNGLPDEELMILVQKNDEKAFEELVNRYQHPLASFISRYLGKASVTEDILQETFVRVWRHRMRYKTVAKFSTWIYTIAGNLSKTELRRQKIRRMIPIRTGGESIEEEGIEIEDLHADPTRDTTRFEIRKMVEREIAQLPDSYRQAVILRDINDKSYEEIAEILNVPVGTVKSRVNRGRARLQKKLAVLREPGQSGWEPD